LQAALACFAQKGYYQTSMDDIVAQSELSKGALYWHFKSKQELFVALIEWFMLELGEQIFACIRRGYIGRRQNSGDGQSDPGQQ